MLDVQASRVVVVQVRTFGHRLHSSWYFWREIYRFVLRTIALASVSLQQLQRRRGCPLEDGLRKCLLAQRTMHDGTLYHPCVFSYTHMYLLVPIPVPYMYLYAPACTYMYLHVGTCTLLYAYISDFYQSPYPMENTGTVILGYRVWNGKFQYSTIVWPTASRVWSCMILLWYIVIHIL